MSLNSPSESDGRILRAHRAMRKIASLGLSREQVIALYQQVTAPQASATADETADHITLDRDERVQVAQDAIRNLVALGFAECEIADLGGLSASTISRVLDPYEARVLGPGTVARLLAVLERAGTERLKALLPKLRLTVLETCCDKGGALTPEQLEAGAREALLRTLVMAEPADSVVPGVTAVLVQVGDDEDGVWMVISPFGGARTNEAKLARARAREHEFVHLLQLMRREREKLETLLGARDRREPPKDSYI